MANGTLKATIGFLILSFLSVSAMGAARTGKGWNATEVKTTVENLKLSLVKMKGLEAKIESSKVDLATKILRPDGRQSAYNEVSLDGRILRNYRAEAWDDVGYLQNHWKRLSDSEKSLVDQAKFDLGDLIL